MLIAPSSISRTAIPAAAAAPSSAARICSTGAADTNRAAAGWRGGCSCCFSRPPPSTSSSSNRPERSNPLENEMMSNAFRLDRRRLSPLGPASRFSNDGDDAHDLEYYGKSRCSVTAERAQEQRPLALATVAATLPPPRPAPAASTAPASPAPQTTDPLPSQPPPTPATSNSQPSHTQQQIEEPSSVRSEEKLSWGSDDEEEGVVPDLPVVDVRRPEAPPHAADSGAPGKIAPREPGASAASVVPDSPVADVRRPEAPPHAADPRTPGKIASGEPGASAASTGIQGHNNGVFKLQSEIVVPDGRARVSILSRGGCSTLPRPSFKDVLLGQRCSSGHGARRRPLSTEQAAGMASTSGPRREARPNCVPDESEEGWQL
ncbi:hypothetical protein EJB05_32539, partial [Eragrostis curvula]